MASLRLRTMTKPALRVGAASVRIALMMVGAFTGLADSTNAQEAPASSPGRPIAESAERIARQLWSVDDSASTDEQGRPRFRASVTVDEFVLPPPWYETDPSSSRFRRPGTLYHQEFLSVVTPEAFRGGTLNGAAVAPASASIRVRSSTDSSRPGAAGRSGGCASASSARSPSFERAPRRSHHRRPTADRVSQPGGRHITAALNLSIYGA
jgi:hypothetical protein